MENVDFVHFSQDMNISDRWTDPTNAIIGFAKAMQSITI